MKDNGGPAFPVHPDAHNLSDAECATLSGMSLRDYFAAKAMAALIVNSEWDSRADHETGVSKLAYALADAMLRERNR